MNHSLFNFGLLLFWICDLQKSVSGVHSLLSPVKFLSCYVEQSNYPFSIKSPLFPKLQAPCSQSICWFVKFVQEIVNSNTEI